MTSMIKMPLRNVTQHALLELQQKYPDAEVQISMAEHRSDGLMTEVQFWDLISLLDWEHSEDDDAVVEPLVAALTAGPVRQIFDFADILSQKLYALDGLKYAQHIGERSYKTGLYFSGDAFLYVRCCVVANGCSFYEGVLKHPEQMPKDTDFEPLLYVATDAYERKTGRKWDYIPAYNVETFSNEAGWQSADHELPVT
ncbi:MAG: DUF4240 domain-containing protein [Lewinellaceae bacterium]|nr:DUF4240 domain-containing protein [Lewinellaceae bacterium]